ncbi:hypothetical protein Q8A67_021326 [Cirrhinus molitorella]|uniref:Uncharacterized protein n=1 Tax=Cirrhinus molitorella TaxID=172907 RepID=A0AA88P5K3_9TELE|nr:hypothetical protein Q8A67_021326 [Cirrhinus molitorella]
MVLMRRIPTEKEGARQRCPLPRSLFPLLISRSSGSRVPCDAEARLCLMRGCTARFCSSVAMGKTTSTAQRETMNELVWVGMGESATGRKQAESSPDAIKALRINK